jgi:hypothetical protein
MAQSTLIMQAEGRLLSIAFTSFVLVAKRSAAPSLKFWSRIKDARAGAQNDTPSNFDQYNEISVFSSDFWI